MKNLAAACIALALALSPALARADTAPPPPPAAKEAKAKAAYIARHALMAACSGALAVALVGVAGTGAFMAAAPRNGVDTSIDKKSAEQWRKSLGVLLLGGVLPGLALGTAGGAAATAVSALRDREALFQE